MASFLSKFVVLSLFISPLGASVLLRTCTVYPIYLFSFLNLPCRISPVLYVIWHLFYGIKSLNRTIASNYVVGSCQTLFVAGLPTQQ